MMTMDPEEYDPDKNQALIVVIEKLTEIVDNINQDGTSGGKSSGSSTPRAAHSHPDQSKENVDLSVVQARPGLDVMEPVSYLHMNDSQLLQDTAQTVEISTEPGSSPSQVVINLPVVVGDINITNSDVLLESLKHLDHAGEPVNKKDREITEPSVITERFKCSKCEYSSHNKHYLKQHVDLVHTAERPFKCPLCDYAGKRSHSLKEHLVVHSPYRPFMCPFCSASFRKKGHLTNHVKLHASEQAVACSICKHFIANRLELSKHLRQAHVGGDIFLCHTCDYATTNDGDIVMHMHTHGNPTVYRCSECNFIGVHEAILKKHIQGSHAGEGSFTVSTSNNAIKSNPLIFLKCSECGFTTNERESMKEHMYQNHMSSLADQDTQKTNGHSAATSTVLEGAKVGAENSETNEDIDKMESSIGDSKVEFVCSDCKFSSDDKQAMVSHIMEQHQAKTLAPLGEKSLVEALTSQRALKQIQSRQLTGDTTGQEIPEPSNYNCSVCKFACTEVAGFISHMLSHASTSKSGEESSSDTGEDSTKLGFMRIKAGLYCCLICGYTCDHQRTIKAHIWKHSGHKDINYPTFQNGPLSMYEEQTAEGQRDPGPELSGLTGESNSVKVARITEPHSGDNRLAMHTNEENTPSEHPCTAENQQANRKRKVPASATSEMDMSMPKLRIVSAESQTEETNNKIANPAPVVQTVTNLYSKPSPTVSSESAPRSSPRCLSPQVIAGVDMSVDADDDQRTLHIMDDEDDDLVVEELVVEEVVVEEVVDSQDVVEVVVETTTNKHGNEQTDSGIKPESLRDLLQKKKSTDVMKKGAAIVRSASLDCNSSTTNDSQEYGISRSLLAVIEQFRRDVSPGSGSDGNQVAEIDGEEDNYEKVRNLYRCRLCHYTSRFVVGMKSHMKTHKVRKAKECSLCSFVADSSKHLQAHMLKHCHLGKEPTYKCNTCSCMFFYKNQLRSHMNLHNSSKGASKSVDNVRIATELTDIGEVEDDPLSVVDAKRCYVCENCETSYSSIKLLLKHKMKMVCWSKTGVGSPHDEDCLKCNFCHFVGMSVRSLKSHMKRHWNDLRAKHSAQGESTEITSTADANKIQKHFVCERCTGVFDDIMALLAHNTSTCSGAQIPKCVECNFVSSNPDLFKKHMTYHHNQGKIYKCEMCDFVSKSYSRMDSHVKKHIEPSDLHCTLCDFSASSVRSLKSHMKRHTNDQRFVRQPLEQYKCNMCGYICHHLPALKSHMWRHASETSYSYERTNAVINAAIEDGTRPEDSGSLQKEEAGEEDLPEASQYSTISKESDIGDSIIAFRCCHCFFETCIKKELNEHMNEHIDIIQKTMEVNNDLFYSRSSERKISQDAEPEPSTS